MLGFGAIGALAIGQSTGTVIHTVLATFAGSGNADAEFIGTTRFTEMIEDPDLLLTYAAEIHLRSL